MNSPSDMYVDIAVIYIQVLRKDSPDAASNIEAILALYGGRIGLRAALIMTLFKMEVKQNRWIPGVSVYTHLLDDNTDALALVKQAMQNCLKAWGIPQVDVNDWLNTK